MLEVHWGIWYNTIYISIVLLCQEAGYGEEENSSYILWYRNDE